MAGAGDGSHGPNVSSHGFNGTLYADANGTHADDGMPTYGQAVMILMYATITVLAVGGNVIVVYIVLAYQRMRTVTNYFIVNLSMADMIMALICIPFTFISNVLVQYWPFGAVMCPVVLYAQAVAVFISAFTLMAISLDRYVAVIYPMRPRMTSRMAVGIIVLIWFLALAVPLPIAIVAKLERYHGHDYCEETWSSVHQRWVFTIVIMVMQYFLPLFVLMFTYARIAIVIWVKQTPGEAENNRDQRMAASKRKMVKMMMTVVLIYALCWLPLHTVTLVGDMHPEIYGFRYIQVVWCACHWLAMSNSCYNPMVYCWMNSKYRNGFRYVLRFCPCIKYKEDNHGPYYVKRANTYISTVRSSLKDKKSIVTGISPSQSRTIERQYPANHTTPHTRETIPLNNLANGMNKSRWKGSGRSFPRNGDGLYGAGEATVAESEPLTCTLDADES